MFIAPGSRKIYTLHAAYFNASRHSPGNNRIGRLYDPFNRLSAFEGAAQNLPEKSKKFKK